MSQENVDLVERVLEQARHNPAALWEIVDDEAHWESGPKDIVDGPRSYRGPAGVREFFRRWVGAFDDWGYDVGEVMDAGESVVFHMRQWGRGKGSGVPVTDDFWQVWTMHAGKLTHRTRYPDKAAALKAVGLSEEAMSQENVEVVRAACAPWARGDYSSVEWAHPEIEFVVADGPTPGRWTGLAGLEEGWRSWLSAWEEWRVEAEEYRELDGERVLVLFQLSGRGKASGLDVGQTQTKGANLFHVRDGRVTRIVGYWGRERALEAVGLSE